MQSTLYNDVVTEQSRSSLATELMVYHMQVRKRKTHRDRVRDKQTQTKIYIYICVETDRQREWGGGTEGQTDRQRL